MSQRSLSRPSVRVRGRTFMALVLAPEAPLTAWLADLDGQIARSPAFFHRRPIVLDLSSVPAEEPDLPGLMQGLSARGIHVVGVEGADPEAPGAASWAGLPDMSASRPAGFVEVVDAAPKPEPPEPTCLLLDQPVRSGQSIAFPRGDVTIVGSVASGAEVMAGGSIHVYGALRGRAIAGMAGNPRARIFCRRLEAELLAIDGLYRTADGLDPNLRGRPVQAWLDGDSMIIAALG